MPYQNAAREPLLGPESQDPSARKQPLGAGTEQNHTPDLAAGVTAGRVGEGFWVRVRIRIRIRIRALSREILLLE